MTTTRLPPVAVAPGTAPSGSLGSWGIVGVVTQRELLAKLKDKTFIGSTLFLLFVVCLSVALPGLINSGDPHLTVGAVGPRAAAVAAEAARLGTDGGTGGSTGPGSHLAAAHLDVRSLPDAAAAEAGVRAGTLDAALVSTGTGFEVIGDTGLADELPPLLDAAARDAVLTDTLRGAGLDAGGADRALASVATSAPAQRLLHPPASDRTLTLALGSAFAVVFLLAGVLFGMSIAQSVVEEKSSRIVEILVAAIPVRALLAGKVAANTMLALGQTVLLAAVGAIGAGLAGQGRAVGLILHSGGWFLLFFVLGFTMLATLWAASGAVASRIEDLQATTVPLQALLYLPFFAGISVHDPGTPLRVLSYVPFTAPLSMPQRLMLGDASWWEALLSAGIVVVTAAALVGVATRLYERNVLRTAGRVSWVQAWRG